MNGNLQHQSSSTLGMLAHGQIIASLASRITEVYNNDLMNTHLKHDVVCRLISKAIGANSVSLLLYNGKNDDLYCAGRYIDPHKLRANARVISSRYSDEIIAMMNNISAFEFIKYNGFENDVETLYDKYLKCAFSNPIPLGFDEFKTNVYNNFQKNLKDYNKYKSHFQEDRYEITLGNTITGLFYFILSHYEELRLWENRVHENSARLFPVNKFFICDLKNIPKKKITCCQTLKKRLKIEIDTDAFYVGIPLEVNERPIGILRIVLKRELNFEIPGYAGISQNIEDQKSIEPITIKYAFKNYENVFRYVTEIANCQNIALLLSLHLNNSFYAHGMRQIALKPNLTKDFENKNTVANELTEVVNSFGCIVRYSNSKKDKAQIHGFSDSMFAYFVEMDEKRDPYIDKDTGMFKSVFIDLFYSEALWKNNTNSYRIESVKVEFKKFEVINISYQYFLDNYKLISSNKWHGNKYKKLYKELRRIFNDNSDLFASHDIQSVVIIPIKEKEYGFVTLANTSNRQFLTKDIEMIIPVVKRVGTELKYKNTLETLNIKQEEEFQHALRIIFHQLMSPVASLRNHIQNIQDNILPPEKSKLRIEEMLDTYTNFLDMLRSHRFFFDIISKDTIIPKLSEENFFEFVKEKVRTYQLKARAQKGIEINIHEDKSEKKRFGFAVDSDLFSHVIQSLIDNAIKYSYNHLIPDYSQNPNFPPPGTPRHVYVTLKNAPEYYELKFENWGCPIEHDEIESIRQFSGRGRNANDFDENGSGIGLYVVERIVNLLNGKMQIIPKGNHTTIQLTFKHTRVI